MTDILFQLRNRLGLITLNRPSALNALSLEMVQAMDAQLRAWAFDDSVSSVAITSSSEKAFCAGGDVRAVVLAARESPEKAAEFFRAEYALNHLIHAYPKPIIAIVDGLCMGGGMGISVHARHCLVTPRAIMAMPEMAIGFFPDVGAGWFLNRCPGDVGLKIALTGARLSAEQAVAVELATGYIENPALLLRALEGARASEVSSIIIAHTKKASAPSLTLPHAAHERGNFSPTSLRVAEVYLNRAKGLSIEEVLRMEYRLACGFLRHHDFLEGVRAMLIDKDKAPRWNPATVEEVPETLVEAHFAPPFGLQLEFNKVNKN